MRRPSSFARFHADILSLVTERRQIIWQAGQMPHYYR
jgi:hypothetical protein